MAGHAKDEQDTAQADDALAAKIARLSEPKRHEYHAQVSATYGDDRTPHPPFAHRLADAHLKGKPAKAEASDISEILRQERHRVWETGQAQTHTAASAQDKPKSDSGPSLPTGSAAPSTLVQTQPNSLAATATAGDVRSNMPSPEALSPERLRGKLGRYEALAQFHDVERDPRQRHELRDLAAAQTATQRAAGDRQPRPLEMDIQRHDRIVHQQLAQYVSVEAKWMARYLQHKAPAEADRCRRESHQAATLATQLGRETAVVRDGEPTTHDLAQRQEQDAQSKAQDAARKGRAPGDSERSGATAVARSHDNRPERGGGERTQPKLSKGDEYALRMSRQNPARSSQGRGR